MHMSFTLFQDEHKAFVLIQIEMTKDYRMSVRKLTVRNSSRFFKVFQLLHYFEICDKVF